MDARFEREQGCSPVSVRADNASSVAVRNRHHGVWRPRSGRKARTATEDGVIGPHILIRLRRTFRGASRARSTLLDKKKRARRPLGGEKNIGKKVSGGLGDLAILARRSPSGARTTRTGEPGSPNPHVRHPCRVCVFSWTVVCVYKIGRRYSRVGTAAVELGSQETVTGGTERTGMATGPPRGQMNPAGDASSIRECRSTERGGRSRLLRRFTMEQKSGRAAERGRAVDRASCGDSRNERCSTFVG